MARATIISVDDDVAVSQAITRDLRRQLRRRLPHRAARRPGAEALTVLADLALRERPVAMMVSDQRMPRDDVASSSSTQAQDARARGQARSADRIRRHRRRDQGHQRHRLGPLSAEAVGSAARIASTRRSTICSTTGRHAHPDDRADVRVVGHRWSERSHEMKTFLARNHVPYRWLDVERRRRGRSGLQGSAGGAGRSTARDCPRGRDAARAHPRAGRRARARGPAPSSRSTTSASSAAARPAWRPRCTEHPRACSTVVVEREAPGGQAGPERGDRELPRVPEGALRRRPHPPSGGPGATVRRRDGARARCGRPRARGPVRAVASATAARSRPAPCIIATGVSYRLLEARGLGELTGRGVFYGATASEARAVPRARTCTSSARPTRPGQAALNLARFARRVVTARPRSDSLEKSMSQYLVERIRAADEHRGAAADRGRRGAWRRPPARRSPSSTATSGLEEDVTTNWLFVFIGASPRTDWLGDEVVRDDDGASSSRARTC